MPARLRHHRFASPLALPAAAMAALMLFAGCATKPATSPAPVLSTQRIAEIVAAPDRTAADRTNDQRRKPEPMLAFIGIHPGINALDVSAGGGYTTELLARAIGPGGVVYGQSRPRPASGSGPAPAAPEGNSHPTLAAGAAAAASAPPPPAAAPRTSAQMLIERDQRLKAAQVAAAPIVAVVQPFEDPAPAAVDDGRLDLVTLMFNYHDLGFLGVDRAAMNRAIFRALKPGGEFVIADHAGRPGTGISESGTLHRIEEDFLKAEVEAAGFKLADEGLFLRNPNDPRDKNTPNPPQPKDEFVLKFVKP